MIASLDLTVTHSVQAPCDIKDVAAELLVRHAGTQRKPLPIGGGVKRLIAVSALVAAFAFGILMASKSEAVPTFARKYQTSCSTCHYAFPRLNSFGRAFRNNGFHYPGNDQELVKEEPVSLGAESQKKVFPNAIWPADIPGTAPIAFHWVSLWHYQPHMKGHEFSFENPSELAVFMPGTIGDNLSFFLELGWEQAGAFSYGGRVDYKVVDQFHVRIGNIDYLPVQDFERLTPEDYNYGSFQELDGSGIEFWGATNGPQNQGGLIYSTGVINGENDGVENVDLNSNKDIFAKVTYKIGGMGVLGSTSTNSTVEPWRDNSITLGTFGHLGRTADATKIRNIGGNADVFFGDLNLFGLAMVEQSKVPGDESYANTTRFFTEGDYVIYPWLIPLVRLQYTKPENESAVTEIVPAIVVLVRANVKIVPTALFDTKNSENNRYTIQFDIGI